MSSKSKLLALTLLIAVVAYWYNSFSSQSNGPLVITSIGKVRGVISHSRNGREFVQFLGLPYAHPPVGEKRFEVFPYQAAGEIQYRKDFFIVTRTTDFLGRNQRSKFIWITMFATRNDIG